MSFRILLGAPVLSMFLAGCGGGGGGGSGAGGATMDTGGTTMGTGGTGGTTMGTGGTTMSTGGSTTGSGGGCSGVEPVLPGSACTPGDPVCHAATNACLALKEFSGAPVFHMRVSQLDISKPDALTAAKNPVVSGILSNAVVPALPDCNLGGDGTFSWLLSFDLANKKLRTGTAAFNDDAQAPYSFGAGSAPGGAGVDFPLSPASLDLVFGADGCQFQSSGAPATLQIFLTDAQEYILLPIVNLAVAGQISAGHNCIGAYDVAAADPADACQPAAFDDGGSFAALVPLEAADESVIAALKKTFCALLTGMDDGGMPYKACPKDAAGVITAKGDACLATGGPATAACADALFFKANFAASGVEILN